MLRYGGWGGVIMFLLLRSLGLFFCYLFLCYACRLPHHLARNTSCYAFGRKCYVTLARKTSCKVSHQRKEFCRSLSEVDPKLSKKAGTQVIDRKWKALKDFLPSNYHRKINGPRGSQVNPRMRQRVFQFCWRNSLKWPSPAQFLKQLAKLHGKKL